MPGYGGLFTRIEVQLRRVFNRKRLQFSLKAVKSIFSIALEDIFCNDGALRIFNRTQHNNCVSLSAINQY